MNLAVIESGFYAESTSLVVVADVADGATILIYDDESKGLIGSATVNDATATVTVSPKLFSGQRVIAYIDNFGDGTYGAVVVTESDIEYTGWKVPETVNGQSYQDYLNAGGQELPYIYDPAECRNFARDMDAIERAIDVPITFNLRQIESQGGTVQVIIENIAGAIGGYKTRFDADAEGTSTSKIYNANGTFQVKIWGINQLESQAIVKTYTLTMPTAVVAFGTTVVDLTYFVDYGQLSSPGLKPLRVVVYTSVPVQVQIDGISGWEIAAAANSYLPGETGRYEGPVHFVAEGEYTIRCRKALDGTQVLVRQIKLNNYFS